MELFGFLQFFLSSGFKLCCSLIISKSVEKVLIKYDLLFFVGNKDKSGKSKLLSLESAKIFCGSGPQLCYQLWLLHAIVYRRSVSYYDSVYTNDGDERSASVTQYLSIISSILLMTKSAFELLSYQRSENDTANDEDKSTKEKIMEVLKIFVSYLSWLPLILTSLLYKVWSINLYMRFFGWASFGMFIGIFLLNIVCSLLVPAITNSRMRLKYPKKNTPEGSNKTLLEKIYLSYANMFVITRPLDTFSSTSMNAALLIQPVQCLVNIIFIPVYLSFSDVRGDGSHSTLSGFQIMQIDQAVVILILTLVNIILCFTNISCKISCAVCPSRGSEFRQAQISNQNKNQEPVNFTSVELDERGGDCMGW